MSVYFHPLLRRATMNSFGALFLVLACFAFANPATACPLATTSVVASCDAVQPAQPVVAVQALAVPSVAVVAPTAIVSPAVVVTTPFVSPTVVVNEVVHRRIRPAARVRANRVRVQVR
jgi:hypothetical protein